MSSNKKFSIDKTKCIKCKKCIEVCPMRLLEWSIEKKEVTYTEDVENFCHKCCHCLLICNEKAIELPGIDNSNLTASSFNESSSIVEELIQNRRSIRKYKADKIPLDEIKKIIFTASHAPSASNSRLLNWKVYSDQKIIHEISKLTVEWMKCQLAVKGSFLSERYVKIFNRYINSWNNGIDGILRSAPHFVIVYGPDTGIMRHIDGVVALDYFEFSAVSKGFGTCWAGLFYYAFEDNYKPLAELIDLPENQVCYGAMMFGYPKYKYPLTQVKKEANICFIDN
ncbi:MAG TPA: nitroreductase family protein [Victivallales bacterium]|nr:nitroreductase family protein [Victivallales bacterium]